MKNPIPAVVLLLASSFSHAQTGPNSPASGTNVTGIGANAWTSPGNILTSNNGYATCATKGLTNYLVGTNFGFAIASPAGIDGIQVDIEKSTNSPGSVALLDGWSTGLTKTVSAGTNRILIVIIGQENGTGTRDITGLTYGGVAMTALSSNVLPGGTGFNARIEAWYMLEAQLATAVGTTLVPTYAAGVTLTEYCEVFSSATFSNVDQLTPITSSVVSGFNGSTDPHQLGSALTTLTGSMCINGVVCGNNTTPASVNGGTGTYSINSTYTEGTDIYFSTIAPAAGNTSGACLQTAHKAIATAGTSQPSCDFTGSVNRHVMLGFVLQRARELDNEVRIVKSGAVTGTDLSLSTAWPTTDTYSTYGGSTSLWGTAWTVADINSTSFGAAISARVQNGTARVDHMRITVYSHSTLPIELLDFSATPKSNFVELDWITASETNNAYFMVQRSADGINYEDIGRVEGAGNSTSVLFYNLKDQHPLNGTSYYRLKQVDFNGDFEYSPVRTVNYKSTALLIYPNPTYDGNITIYSGNIAVNEVAVYSTDLKLVKRATLVQGINPIVNIEDLAEGTYFLLVKTEKESKVVKVMKTSRER